MEEIKFLNNNLEEERQESIKELLRLLEEKPVSNEVFATRRFMISVMYAVKSIKERKTREEQIRQARLMPKILKKTEQNVIPEAAVEEAMPVLEIPEIGIPEPIELEVEEKPAEIKTKQEYGLIMSLNQTLAKAVVDLEIGKQKYQLIEPNIDSRVLLKTIDILGGKIKKDASILKNDKLLMKAVEKACKKYKIEFNNNYFENVKYYLYRDYLYFGRIDPLMWDKNISKIVCDGINRAVIVLFNNKKIETNIVFNSCEEVNNLLFKFDKLSNKVFNAASPILDTVINNFRVEATFGLEEISSRFSMTRVNK